MKYLLSLTTQSFVLPGSGEGGVLIDSDVVFHRSGFPMIPARRVKGMLKESIEEVMEICGEDQSNIAAILQELFGQSGATSYEGKLLIGNLMWKNWSNVKRELATLPQTGAFQPEFIQAYHTQEIQQTALDERGIARDKSLRNYRTIQPNRTFEGVCVIPEALSSEAETYLKKGIQHLRHIGTRRNRGFGKVRCEWNKHPDQTPDASTSSSTSQGSVQTIEVSIRTLSPVVLADLQGEQNTVFTHKSLSGNQVRGLLANAYLRAKGLKQAQQDGDFFAYFLSGELQFGPAHFGGTRAIPSHIHRYKYDENKPPISVFSKAETDQEITKAIGGFGMFDGTSISKEGATPSTTFNFHNSREHRAAGRNKEDDTEGGIFYYESLDEGQSFTGQITGDSALLSKLAGAFPDAFEARLGRSRSAQYGRVQVELKAIERQPEDQNDLLLPVNQWLLISLTSPLILLNDAGFPSPTRDSFKKALQNSLSPEEVVQVELGKSTIAFSQIEQFNSIWRSKSDKISAIREGSTFQMKLLCSQGKPIPKKGSLGEWTEQGFGQWEWEIFNSPTTYSLHEPTESADLEAFDTELPDVQSPELQELLKAYTKELQELNHKQLAIEKAQKARRNLLNNHLIGRLERLFQRSETPEKIAEWIEATQGKPAGDALRKANLVDDDHKFNLKPKEETDSTWELHRLYWITFFQTLRKMNKKHGK